MTTFTLNRQGIADLAVGPEMQATMKALSEDAKKIGEGLAQDFRSGEEYPRKDEEIAPYADSFEARVEILDLPAAGESSAHRAACAVLVNTSGHAIAVEYGYEGRADAPGRKPHRIFGRILAMLGGGS
jgi:xanthine/CO dehydrogenase XdhC/CoxF family maturation factor